MARWPRRDIPRSDLAVCVMSAGVARRQLAGLEAFRKVVLALLLLSGVVSLFGVVQSLGGSRA